jgi:excisionase family DNA binding protein
MSDEKLYTTQEVADLVGVSSRTIQLWAGAGIVKAWKTPGGHRRFPEAEVQRLQDNLGGQSTEQRQTILVVEHQPDLQTLYRLSIESWNLPADVIMATDGYEGLLKVGLYTPKVVILDLLMPDADGFRVLEVLESSGLLEDTLVMVVSAMSEAEIGKRGRLPQAVQVFTKPIPFSVIRECVVAHLDN